MSLSNVTIKRSDGALSRPPASQDGVSGLVYYGTESSAGTSGTALYYKIFTAKDSEVFTPSTSKLRYHINRYFKWSQSPLYICLVNATSTTFTEVVSLKDYANSEIRLMAVLNDKSVYSSTQLSALQTVATQCEAENAPLQIFYSAKITGNVSALPTIATINSRVSFNIAESLTGQAKALKDAGATWIGSIGEMLGVKSLSKVSDSIAWYEKYNLIDGDEWAQAGFINGEAVNALSKTLLNTLDTYHYTFVITEGIYTVFNYGYTAIADTSDYSTIENNTTYDAAFRNIRTALLPKVNSPLKVNSAGKLDFGVIQIFKALGAQALQTMKDNEEISDYEFDIDENQNVLSTSKLEIVAKIIPVGVAKAIEVTLGFALKLN